MLEQLKNSIEMMKNRLLAEHPERFMGYRLSNGKGKRMTELKTHAQWAVIEERERMRKAAVAKARQMIEWAYSEYEHAKGKNKHNIKLFTILTLQWTPARVLSTHKDFKRLCAALKDEQTWKMLSRKERRIIADAVGGKHAHG
jgi:hypothetical protein